jgi:putative redox protein
MAVKLRWLGDGMRFAGGPDDGPQMVVDGDGKVGLSPMTTFLVGLAGCTASDIVDIARKMRVHMGALDVEAIEERREEPPRHWTRVTLHYHVAGVADADRQKIERAVALSHERYCSALHSIRKDVPVECRVTFE